MYNYDWYLDQGHDNCREELNDHEILKMAKKYDLEDEDEILRFAREVINEFAEVKPMNKLLDWEIYLTNNNLSITNSADRLEHSSVGKAFSAGWEAALKAQEYGYQCHWTR
jgi:hypothetical protein